MIKNYKSYASYSSYFGVTRPINPGIRVLVDFLNNYFKMTISSLKFKEFKEFVNIEKIRKMENLICKETDEKMKNMLYESFGKWVESYGFSYSYINKNDIKYLLPLTPNMLYEDKLARERLRNILFILLYSNREDKFKYISNDKANINKFLFGDLDKNNIYSNIVNVLNDVVEIIWDEYDVDINRCKDDIFELVEELLDNGLVKVNE